MFLGCDSQVCNKVKSLQEAFLASGASIMLLPQLFSALQCFLLVFVRKPSKIQHVETAFRIRFGAR